MDDRETAGVTVPPPLLYLIPLALGVALRPTTPVHILPPDLAHVLGGLLVAGGLLLPLWAARTMRRARTPINPARPTRALVVTGPFRFSRNPMYLGLTSFYLGVTLLAQAVWALAFLPCVLVLVQRTVIEREERYLERRFGADYLHYKVRVRRWL